MNFFGLSYNYVAIKFRNGTTKRNLGKMFPLNQDFTEVSD
jgi:hypothetical protein